jgi:hypothetical protein
VVQGERLRIGQLSQPGKEMLRLGHPRAVDENRNHRDPAPVS